MPSSDDTDGLGRRSVLKAMMTASLVPAGAFEARAQSESERSHQTDRLQDVVPTPVETKALPTDYKITANSSIVVRSAEARDVGKYLAEILRPSTGYELPIIDWEEDTDEVEGEGEDEDEGRHTAEPPRDPVEGISLLLSGTPSEVGVEGYRLDVTPHGVKIRANDPAGLFNGVQTLRQLLPSEIESDTEQSGPWVVPGAQITDHPRFEYRSAMLDVARHFFPVEAVKTYIDELSLYKINHLHLHLTDDQGWRIEIDSWPKLTEIGGSTEVGGGPSGYYTKAEYKEIVDYAQARNITIVPEIDMPGHTNAALASYAELNCDGERNDLYTGTDVGFSSLCVDKEVTYEFVEDVIREVVAMTPGPYIHVGGDEAHQTSAEEYNEFFDRVLPMVQKYGKRAIGWQYNTGILDVEPPSSLVAQYWGANRQAPAVEDAAQQGNELIASPERLTYISKNYLGDPFPDMGSGWDAPLSVKESYDWDPGSYINGVDESSVLGPEAPLWTETVETITDTEIMAFPRVLGIAELGWSPTAKTNWDEFKHRLAAQAPRWIELNINFYRSLQVPWPVQEEVISVDGFDINSTMLGGMSEEVRVTVANWSTQTTTVTVSLEVPEGWKISGSTTRIDAGDSATVAVEVTPPPDRTEAVLSTKIDAPPSYDVINTKSHEVGILWPLLLTPDESDNNYTGLVRGNPSIVDANSGKVLLLDGEDDYVDINSLQKAPELNFTEPKFTIQARVWFPEITSRIPIVSKGDRQYQLQIRGPQAEKRPEFAIYGDTWHSATIDPPNVGWERNWHTLTGVCTDSELRLYVDGELVDETIHSVSSLNEVPVQTHVGHNAQLASFAAATIDYVHVYDRVLPESELTATPDELTKDVVLWYDFDDFYNP